MYMLHYSYTYTCKLHSLHFPILPPTSSSPYTSSVTTYHHHTYPPHPTSLHITLPSSPHPAFLHLVHPPPPLLTLYMYMYISLLHPAPPLHLSPCTSSPLTSPFTSHFTLPLTLHLSTSSPHPTSHPAPFHLSTHSTIICLSHCIYSSNICMCTHQSIYAV